MCDVDGTDPFTDAFQLCDDDGTVRRGAMHHGTAYPCTSHAHYAGMHIRCTSPAHQQPRLTQQQGTAILAQAGPPAGATMTCPTPPTCAPARPFHAAAAP
jgi:hypothetical protein